MSARLVAIVRMQQRDMGVPGGARVDSEPKGMILRQTHVIGTPRIHEGESAARRRVPRVRWNHIESGLQPRLERDNHRWRSWFLAHRARVSVLLFLAATPILAILAPRFHPAPGLAQDTHKLEQKEQRIQ